MIATVPRSDASRTHGAHWAHLALASAVTVKHHAAQALSIRGADIGRTAAKKWVYTRSRNACKPISLLQCTIVFDIKCVTYTYAVPRPHLLMSAQKPIQYE